MFKKTSFERELSLPVDEVARSMVGLGRRRRPDIGESLLLVIVSSVVGEGSPLAEKTGKESSDLNWSTKIELRKHYTSLFAQSIFFQHLYIYGLKSKLASQFHDQDNFRFASRRRRFGMFFRTCNVLPHKRCLTKCVRTSSRCGNSRL